MITEVAGEGSAHPELRPVAQILDREPALEPELLRVLEEEARACLCPLGLALAAALPSEGSPRRSRRIELTARGEAALESRAARGELRRLLERARRAPLESTLRAAPDAGALVDRALADGLLRSTSEPSAAEAAPRPRRIARLRPGVDGPRAAAALAARAPTQSAVLRELAGGPLSPGDLEQRVSGARRALAGLVRRGLAELADLPPERPSDRAEADPGGARVPDLTEDQAGALAPLSRAVRERRAEVFLLHGVTGSGKTEIYLRAIAEALAIGRQALVLVPEITLTHQILGRLRARFGDVLAVLHSGLRPGERVSEWRRLRRGEVPIAVGARSALFAPLGDLGLIVIDEEHDPAYKNGEGFRYHARDLARRRARAAGCPLVLGSATPSLETRHAAEVGELTRLVLPRRVGGRPLPSVEIVDLDRERAVLPSGRKLILSRSLESALRQTLAEGGQSILLLNRRGFSTQVLCFECGRAERCDHCDVALVFHAGERLLRCHFCDHTRPPPGTCPGCGAPDTALLGVGTQRVEEEVRTRLPEARILRLDRDTAARRGYTESVLRRLRRREVDIVIGTQMVAKGHDYPGVQLVGVIAADLGLHIPDFRAAERTFQLLTQVAGRAGRGTRPGRVIIQTWSPDHYAIRPVRDHDYEAFYYREREHRKALGFPPFGALALVLTSSPDPARAEASARALAAAAREGARNLEVLGPAPAPLARLRGRSRFQVLIKGPDPAGVLEAARRAARAAEEQPRDVRSVVDPSPYQLL